MTQASDGTILVEVGGNAEAAGWYVLRPGRRELEPYERPRAVETGQTRIATCAACRSELFDPSDFY